MLEKCHLCSRICLNKLGLLNHMRTVHKKVNSVKYDHLKKNKETEIKNLEARKKGQSKAKKIRFT